MSKLNINFNDYKSSGVYFLEIDNSIIESVVATSGRLAVGFSKKGPFNAPVYIDNSSDLSAVYGSYDTKLERKGVFFNRSMTTLLQKAPFYALNLVPFIKNSSKQWESYDKVGISAVGMKPSSTDTSAFVGYPDLYDKSRFWKTSTDYLNKNCVDSSLHNLLNIANVGTGDFTVIIRKAEGLTGFNKTVKDWYGTSENIPYKWMVESDYISDYFVQIICIEGKWNDIKLSYDTFWKNYFEADSSNNISVIKRDMLSKFMKLDSVNVIGDYTGCVMPNFYDGQGTLHSIDKIVNQYTNKTGLMVSIDEEALEENDKTIIDFVGHTVTTSDSSCKFMSYNFSFGDVSYVASDTTVFKIENNTLLFADGWKDKEDIKKFGEALSVGCNLGTTVSGSSLVKVVKKQVLPLTGTGSKDSSFGEETKKVHMIFTLSSAISSGTSSFRIIPEISSVYKTLVPHVMKGLDIDAKVKDLFTTDGTWTDSLGYTYYGEDVAIAKILSVLEEPGIQRSLLNDNTINFRYLIDTFGHGLGLECGSKKYLARLAKKKQHCTAIINAPSIKEFSTTNLACYYDEDDDYQTFDSKYVPLGGNDSLIKTEEFSLPTEDNGSKHCGVFIPYLKYRSDSTVILVPPAADVANAYMEKFDGADPYITVANQDGILTNSLVRGVEYDIDQTDMDSFEPFGLNSIISRSGDVMIYGDRTAYQDVISDFNYLHVREILNTIEIECQAVLDRYVFKYNNATIRSEVVKKLNPILKGMADAGALYKYEIEMDENNNPDEVIDRSFALVDIGVWITKNMEKIIARVKVNKLSK